MRTSLILAAILSASVARAEMPTATPASGQQSQAKGPLAKAAAVVTRPFHRQPIFLGMLSRNNDIRRRAGLYPHRINPALTAAAQDHANHMARTGQFSHYTNGGPQSRANRYGFRGGVRENIAYGTRSVDGAFNMWTNSGAHYASIVSGTSEAGFGYAVSSGGQAYWVGVYASPAQGDAVGESQSAVAAALAEEAQRLEAEKNLAQDQPQDSNVVPASAETPVEDATAVTAGTPATTAPAAVATPANASGGNPAGNTNVGNAPPRNYYYYNNNNSNSNSRRGRRR